MKRLLTALASMAALLLVAACTQAFPTHVATLQPTGTSSASGSATARLIGDDLTVEGTYADLSGPPNGAEVYDEVAVAAVFQLDVEADTSGGFSGTGALSTTQIDRLNNGDLSIRIYTDAYPVATTVGELEGNLETR